MATLEERLTDLAEELGSDNAALHAYIDELIADVAASVLDLVRDFGGVGDDATDNSTALQAWVTAVKTQHKTGIAPPGTYRHSATIDHSGSSYCLWGAGNGATVFRFTGNNAVGWTADDTANFGRRSWGHFTIEGGSGANVTAFQAFDVGRSQYFDVRFRAAASGGKACRIVGITDNGQGGVANRARSSYYNDFYSCEFAGGSAGYCLEFVGSANRNRWNNCRFDGVSEFIKCDQGSDANNIGTNQFLNCAIATTNTAALTLGIASGHITRVTNFLFQGCNFEPGTEDPCTIILHPNTSGITFIATTFASQITVTDNSSTLDNVFMGCPGQPNKLAETGRKALWLQSTGTDTGITFGSDCEIWRSSAGILKTNADFRVDSVLRIGIDLTSGMTLNANTITAAGTNTNTNLNLRSKGTGRLIFNVGGTGTGGTQIEDTAGKVAFFGTLPVVKQTGNLFTALTTMGLVGSPTLAVSDITSLSAALAALQPLDADLTAIAAISPADDDFMQRKSGVWVNRTVAQVKTDLGISGTITGTNTGDQTSIVGITGTKAQFNTAVTDGDIVYVGDSALTDKADKTGSSDIEITDATKGVILRSANGTRYRVTVDNDGSLITSVVP